MKLKQRSSNLKVREKVKKLKIKEKINNLKEDIKARPLKYVMPIILIVILDYPLTSYAEDKGTCPNPAKAKPKSKLEQYRELGVSAIGLSKCLDPRATPLQKALYCSRPCCIIAGLTAGCIAENSPVGSKVHLVASACCVGSWNAYGILLICDRKKTRIPKE